MHIGNYLRGKTAVFIDAGNIYYSQKSLGWKVDYSKLKAFFENLCVIQGFYYYTGFIGELRKQTKFLRKLEKIGYTVKAKEVKRIIGKQGRVVLKANLDVELAVDIIAESVNFDTLVIFSGDSDFAYVLDILKGKGKQIVVVSSRNHVSKELVQRGKFIPLNSLRSGLEFVEKKSPRPQGSGDV